MTLRVCARVLLFKDDRLLLVKHLNPKTGAIWWVPPGGGVEQVESLQEAAIREMKEEVGLTVTLAKLVYIRQFIRKDDQLNQISLFFLAGSAQGTETLAGNYQTDEHITEFRYFSREEMQSQLVYPQMLKTEVWEDHRQGFPSVKFLQTEKVVC